LSKAVRISVASVGEPGDGLWAIAAKGEAAGRWAGAAGAASGMVWAAVWGEDWGIGIAANSVTGPASWLVGRGGSGGKPGGGDSRVKSWVWVPRSGIPGGLTRVASPGSITPAVAVRKGGGGAAGTRGTEIEGRCSDVITQL
jgi:hypothetical protein